jgi:hypothetical protein
MQIEYCESCKTKLTEQAFKTGQAMWVSNQPFCKDCGEKAAQAKAAASRSGARATPSPGRSTPPPGRSTSGQQGRKSSTPGGTAVARRSGLHRAAPGEPAKSSGGHPRQSSPHGHAAAGAQKSLSVMMVSVIGAAIGVLLAVLVIMIFIR